MPLVVMPDGAKCVAIADMLLGRLELFTILVMLHPQFWEGYFIKNNLLNGIVSYRRANNMNIIKRPLGLYKANCYVLIKMESLLLLILGFIVSI